MARAMVCEYGMSEKLGSISFEQKDGLVFVGRDWMKEKHYSEQTAQIIDAEVKRIVEECHQDAISILKKNRKFLKTMAEALLEREVLEGSDVDNILAGKKISSKPQSKKPESPSAPAVASEGMTPKVALKPQANPGQAMKGRRPLG